MPDQSPLFLLVSVTTFFTSTVARAREEFPFPSGIPSPPPLMNTEIGNDLRRCSAEADARGEFGDIVVELANLRLVKLVPSRQIGRQTYACVSAAVERLLESERRSHKGQVDAVRETGEVPIGRPRPILPALETFFPAWDAYVTARASQQDETRRRLEKILPPDLTIDSDRCLRTDVQGMIIDESVSQWLQTIGRREIPEVWRYLFDDRSMPDNPSPPAFLVSPARVLRALSSPTRLCLDDIEKPDRRAHLRRRMDDLGACWVGDLNEILMTPRTAFPRDRQFKMVTISPNGATVCALEASGRPFCCGRNANKYALPAGPFDDLALSGRGARDFSACAVRARSTVGAGTVECWGDVPPPSTPVMLTRFIRHSLCGVTPAHEIACVSGAKVALPEATQKKVREAAFKGGVTCAVVEGGKVVCSTPNGARTLDGTFSNVDVGAMDVCALDRERRVHCWDARTFSPLPAISSDRRFRQIVIGSSGGGLCGVTTSGSVDCLALGPERRAPPRTDARFSQIAEAAGRLCGVTSAGLVECWAEGWPPILRSYQDRKPFGGLRPF